MVSPTPQQSALSNELILEIIFGFVSDVEDLRAVRLVCPLWKRTSLKQWRKSGVVVVLQGGLSNWTTNLALISRAYQSYKLIGWDFTADRFKEEEELINTLGAAARYLHLEGCSFSTFPVLEKFLTVKVQNLWKLHLYDCKLFEPFRRPWMAARQHVENENVIRELREAHGSRTNFQWKLRVLELSGGDTQYLFFASSNLLKLLYCLPNLEEITLRHLEGLRWHEPSYLRRSCTQKTKLLEGIRTASSIHDNGESLRIRSLDLLDCFAEATQTFARNSINHLIDLPLERLTVDVGGWTSKDDATAMFSRLGNTLKVLKAFRVPIREPYDTVPFSGQMVQLRELQLWGTFTSNLTFLKETPNLEMLILKNNCFEKREKLKTMVKRLYLCQMYQCQKEDLVRNTLGLMGSEGSPSHEQLTLATLKHLEIDNDITAESIGTLGNWLPNVTTLKMVLNNDGLKALSEAWPKLSKLECLFGSKVDDEGVSCLKQMTALKSFKVSTYCNEGLLSSSSANQVFLKMKELQDLDICVSNKMSGNSEAALTRKIANVTLIRNYDVDGGQKHSHHECCDRLEFLEKTAIPTLQPKVLRSSARRLQ